MKSLFFYKEPQKYNPDGVFVAHVTEVNNEDELFKQLSDNLLFPDYFGYNWNAIFDLLCDFHWIEQKKVVLVHDDLPNLKKRELDIYLEVLVDSIRDWKEGEEHSFEVVFPESTRDLICSVIAQIES